MTLYLKFYSTKLDYSMSNKVNFVILSLKRGIFYATTNETKSSFSKHRDVYCEKLLEMTKRYHQTT
jgi:hypothetical protein